MKFGEKKRKRSKLTFISLSVGDHKVKISTTTKTLGFEYLFFQICKRDEAVVDGNREVVFSTLKLIINGHFLSSYLFFQRRFQRMEQKQCRFNKKPTRITSPRSRSRRSRRKWSGKNNKYSDLYNGKVFRFWKGLRERKANVFFF